jgi:uncharacterized protein
MASLRNIAGTGLDRQTGKVLTGWPHVVQSLEVIFTTGYGERVMREWFGSFVPYMLGQNLVPETVVKFYVGLWTAIEAFEPRFRVTRFLPLEVTRTGRLRVQIEGEYRPRGHLGDYSVEGARKVAFSLSEDRTVSVSNG